jgi:hypothetical protein
MEGVPERFAMLDKIVSQIDLDMPAKVFFGGNTGYMPSGISVVVQP